MRQHRFFALIALTLSLTTVALLLAQSASAQFPRSLAPAPAASQPSANNPAQTGPGKDTTTAAPPSPSGPLSASGEPSSKVEQPNTPPASGAKPEVISAGTYAFTSAAGVALENMSTGTTQLVAGNLDDTASLVKDIGFEFWFDGVRYTQLSVNANGLMRLGPTAATTAFTNDLAAVANVPQIAPYWDDLWTGYNGKVHYKVIGSAPNRKLVVEWLNEQIPRVAGNLAGAGTFQAWLFETSGVIEFVYGSGIGVNTTNAGYSVGFGSSATQFASVTTTGPTVAYGTANNTQTNAIASGTAYLFTPNVPAAASGLNFTGVTQTAMTVNWTDNATNEVGYVIYRSTDGTNYTFVTQLAAGSTSYATSGLLASSTYFWRIYAVSEGALSTVLAGSQATLAPTPVSSTGAGGLWSSTTTWVGGVLPTASDSVTIAGGATVTIDTAAVAYSVTVNANGLLTWDSAVASTLTTGGPVTVNAQANFDGPATGTVTTHVLSIGGNLTNNGQMDFSTNGDTAGANITFTGAANSTVSGSGGGMDVRGITINKGTSSASVLEWMPTVFTVQGVTTDVAGFLTLTNGTFKISGSYAMTNRVFTSPTYIIPATAGIWLNNPNFTVAGQAGGTTSSNNGLLRLTLGTYNVGVGAADGISGGAGAVFIIEGGTMNATGRFSPQGASLYTQTGGTINVATVGNSVSNFGSFEIFSTGSSFTMSGGTINVINPSTGATKVDWRVSTATLNTTITGGTIVIGPAGAPASSIYNAVGQMTSTTINATMTMRASGTIFMRGTTVINNGTIDGTGTPRYDFGSQTGAMSYSGSGIFGTLVTPFAGVGVSANSLFSTTLTAPIIVNRINLFQGGFINSNQITLGNGAASQTVVQTGSAGLTTAAGSFDVSPVHNQGTGGQVLIYAFETQVRNTGFEVNPTRNVTSMSLDNASFPVNITGGNITATSAAAALTLTNGRFVTGANVLYLSSGTATVTRTNGYIDGNFRKNYTAVASKLFEVGTANGYSPVTANVTAGTFPADVTVKATQTAMPSIPSPSLALQRYWTLTATGLTADLTFNYLDPTDIPGTATEANFVIFKYDGALTQPGGTVTPATNQAAITGVTGITADWTLAEPAGANTATPTNTVVPTNTPTQTRTSTATNTVGAGTATPTVTASPTCGGPASWVTGPALSPGRTLYQGAVAGDGNFYVAGGQATGAGTPVANVDRFVTSSSTWNALAPLPVAAGQVSVGAAGNKVYVAGGFLGGTAITSTLRIYDIPSNTWSFGASMPGSVEAGAGAVLAGKFYVMGGDDFNNAVATNYIYDIAGNTWSTGAPLPAVRTNTVGTAVGGLVYLFGGADAAFAAVDTLYSYNPGTNTWTTLAPAGTGGNGNYGGISPYTAGKLLATDGATTAFVPSVTTHIYDIAGNTWSAGPNLLLAHAGHAQGLLPDGRTIIAGGLTTGGATTTDVELLTSAPCGTVTVTPTVGGTNTPTRTVTVTPTPNATTTCVPSAGGWTTGPVVPSPVVRAVGVYFPANGKLYSMGGRTTDTAGSDLTNPLEYTPGGAWVTKASVYPDNQVNNMACGVITVTGTPYIYCVGGSAAGATTATARVFRYNPVTDVVSAVAGDDWPGDVSGTVLPGGFAVLNNKLYIIGGFDINVAMTNQIWEYDPNAGTHWTQKVNLPVTRGYVPATGIGSFIYTGGGSDYVTAAVTDNAESFKFDPAANTIVAIPNIPRATGETRAVAVGGKMWVLGGGRVAPNPSTEVNIYDPATNTWSVGAPFLTARRNFTADSDGSRVWTAGGYAPTAPSTVMENYTPGAACGTVTATATAPVGGTSTATRTNTPGVTNTPTLPATVTRTGTPPLQATSTRTATPIPTTCPVQFNDVPNGSTFYEFIRCLACRGIVNGYPCGGPGEPCPGNYFRPNNNVTRGQVSKIVSESAAFADPVPSTQWTFQDVPPSGTFWLWVERLSSRGIIGGYPCGGPFEPCVAPTNRPYFRPNNDVTRGQLSKIVSGAAGWTETPTGQTFEDVAPGSTFWVFIERIASRGIVSGYPCGGVGEPCVAPGNRPYFRPFNNATRGQMSKIAASAFFPGCATPARPNANSNS